MASGGSTISTGGGLVDRYAAALYSHAGDMNALDAVVAEMDTLGRTIDASADLRRLLGSPLVDINTAQKAARTVLQTQGFGKIVQDFVGVVASNRRLSALRSIIVAFAALVAEKRDIGTKMALERDVRLVRFEDGQIEIALQPSAPKTFVHDLQRKLTAWTGKRWIVVVSKEQGAMTVRAQADARQAEVERDVQSDPLVQEVLNKFPGAKIVAVTQNAPEAAVPDAAPPEEDED